MNLAVVHLHPVLVATLLIPSCFLLLLCQQLLHLLSRAGGIIGVLTSSRQSQSGLPKPPKWWEEWGWLRLLQWTGSAPAAPPSSVHSGWQWLLPLPLTAFGEVILISLGAFIFCICWVAPVLVLQQLVGVKEEEEGSCRNAFYKLLRFPGGSKGQECRGNV